MRKESITKKLKRFTFLFGGCIFVFAAFGILAPATADAVNSTHITTPPCIDGILGTSEGWNTAGQVTFDVNLPGGSIETNGGTLYVMNDASNLYIALEIDYVADRNAGAVLFDNDHDGGYMENGEDILFLNPSTTYCDANGFCDQYFENGGSNDDILDTVNVGTNDGAGGFSNSGGTTIYEFSHPLNTGDDFHDFSLSPGDTVGFNLYIRLIRSPGSWPTDYGETSFPAPLYDASQFGDIVLASPSPGPLAGDWRYNNYLGNISCTQWEYNSSSSQYTLTSSTMAAAGDYEVRTCSTYGESGDCLVKLLGTGPIASPCWVWKIESNDELNYIQTNLDSTGSSNVLCTNDYTPTTMTRITDTCDDDGDGIYNGCDNCPTTYNPLQEDTDTDGIGDACQCDDLGGDSDGDGVCDSTPDNCIDTPNTDQLDADGDGLGDACDGDDNLVNATAVPDVGSGIKECCVSFYEATPTNPIYTINPEIFVRIQYKDVLDNWKDLNKHRDPVVHIIENAGGSWGGDVIKIEDSNPICVNIPDAEFAELEKLGAVAVRCKFENLVADPDDTSGEDPPNTVDLLRYTAIFSGEVSLNEWVRIDLKPGNPENPINCKSKGKTPLVIYGAEGFDACDLDPSTLFLNGARVALKKDLSYMAHFTDEDEDGFLDLFLHFYTQEIKLHSGNQTVHLTGQTYDGKTSVAAKDAVNPFDCPVE